MHAVKRPQRVLITIDAVGGVWRYGVDLAGEAGRCGNCVQAGRLRTKTRCSAGGRVPLVAERIAGLDGIAARLDGSRCCGCGDVAGALVAMAQDWGANLLHLNNPSQAAGLPESMPVVVTSHSCLATWWSAVKGNDLPHDGVGSRS